MSSLQRVTYRLQPGIDIAGQITAALKKTKDKKQFPMLSDFRFEVKPLSRDTFRNLQTVIAFQKDPTKQLAGLSPADCKFYLKVANVGSSNESWTLHITAGKTFDAHEAIFKINPMLLKIEHIKADDNDAMEMWTTLEKVRAGLV